MESYTLSSFYVSVENHASQEIHGFYTCTLHTDIVLLYYH